MDNQLRGKLGDARVEPPLDMWDRIVGTLKQEGLTATGPVAKPTITIRRPRRLRLGYAAAVAVVVCALVFGLRQFGPGLDDDLATGEVEPAPELPFGTVITKPTQDIIADASIVQERPRAVMVMSHPAVRLEREVPVIEVPELEWEEGTMTFETVGSADITVGSGTPRTKWVDPAETERMLKAANAEKRTRPFSMGLYSSNIGNTSSERIVTNPTVRTASSTLTVKETTNGIYSSASPGSTTTRLQHKMPLSGGLSVAFGITDRLSVESGATYTYMLSKGRSSSATTSGTYSISQQLHYVGIPLGVKYDIIQGGHVNLYAGAAGLFEMCVSSKWTKKMEEGDISGDSYSTRLNVRGIQPSVGFHAGAEVKLAKNLGFYVEPGMNYYFETDKQPESYRSENPLNFSLRAGFRVSLR